MKVIFFVVILGILSGCSTISPKNSFSQPKKTQPICISGNCVNGYGTLVDGDETRFIGNFSNGLPHGKGTRIVKDDIMISGIWENGTINGTCFYNGKNNIWLQGDCTTVNSIINFTRVTQEQKREAIMKKATDLMKAIEAL